MKCTKWWSKEKPAASTARGRGKETGQAVHNDISHTTWGAWHWSGTVVTATIKSLCSRSQNLHRLGLSFCSQGLTQNTARTVIYGIIQVLEKIQDVSIYYMYKADQLSQKKISSTQKSQCSQNVKNAIIGNKRLDVMKSTWLHENKIHNIPASKV